MRHPVRTRPTSKGFSKPWKELDKRTKKLRCRSGAEEDERLPRAGAKQGFVFGAGELEVKWQGGTIR